MDTFVALDVEIASRSPLQVCAIGAVRIEHRRETESFSSLVRVEGAVRFTRIHGLTADDLMDASPWPVVWRDLSNLLRDLPPVVAFRSNFDRAAIMAMCGRHRVRLPHLDFVCAAAMIEARYGRGLTLPAALRLLRQSFPGRPHDPLADARAAAMIALGCDPAGAVAAGALPPIQLSKSADRSARAKSR